MELEVLFPGLSLPHFSCIEAEVECLNLLHVENLTATEGLAVFGNAVTDLQTDYNHCVAPALHSDCTLDIDYYVDSDWAGCRTTRKSASGTVVQLLNSTVSFESRTQGTIALSSGEAELYAIGQGTSEALFVKNLITEAKLAKSVNITVHTDPIAGKSMATRFGTSKKTKHVELRFLYVQELVAKGILRLRKIGIKVNCADVLTKYLSSAHLRTLCVFTFIDRFHL